MLERRTQHGVVHHHDRFLTLDHCHGIYAAADVGHETRRIRGRLDQHDPQILGPTNRFVDALALAGWCGNPGHAPGGKEILD